MDSVNNAINYAADTANYAADTVKSTIAGTSATANKEVAKDSNATIGTRIDAAKDYVVDKKDEKVNSASADLHDASADVNKERI